MDNVQVKNEYFPDYLVAPGEIIEDYLECEGMSQNSLAEETGLSKEIISEIINGETAITSDIALLFENVLQRPAHFWINLERQYQEDKIRLGK